MRLITHACVLWQYLDRHVQAWTLLLRFRGNTKSCATKLRVSATNVAVGISLRFE